MDPNEPSLVVPETEERALETRTLLGNESHAISTNRRQVLAATMLALTAFGLVLMIPSAQEAITARTARLMSAVAVTENSADPSGEDWGTSPCSWEGENCVETKCCKRAELSCWEQQEGKWASCSSSCEELEQFGGDWTCKLLGEGKGSFEVQPGDTKPKLPTLFCFMVITPQGMVPPGVKEGYEQMLVDEIKKAGIGIFACDEGAVYDGFRATTGEWKSIKNTDVFAKVWRDLKQGGQWKTHDWTVKSDADAVFLPNRLKQHIVDMRPPAEPIYLHNIDFKFKFMGALEVMNWGAVKILMDSHEECMEHIGNEGGEDIFLMQCLDALGVGHMSDFSVLDDKYSNPDNFNLFDVDRCDQEAVVAFHPYKAINSWMGCYKVATKQVKTSQFTNCEHRWEGEACSLSSENDHPGQEEPGTGIVIK